ncbi:MAG: glycosyltransferase family 2 protein [Microbacteriaceae bacterium]|nr:glycosyltransferase family 2 protein [Microbacteriaceae bacterium]
MANPKALPAISVILPVLNEEQHLRASVESVLSQNYPSDIEILIALGPSTDNTHEIAAELAASESRIRLVSNPLGKTTIGMNECIRQAKNDVIVRVDAHSELGENYLSRGVEILLETQADEVGGIMAAAGRSAFQKAVAWAYTSRFGVGGASYHVGGAAGEAESAYLGIFRKDALTRVGGYDESIIRGEDWDLAQRIKATGGKIWFSPELTVTYWPRGRFELLVKQFWSTGVWRGDLTRRNFAAASKRYFAPPLMVLVVLAGLIALGFGATAGIIPLAGYLAAVALLAVSASDASLKTRIAILVVLPTIHFAWGFGFWRGLLLRAAGTLDRSRVSK